LERVADALIEAIDAALARYPGVAWIGLSYRQQSEAIEREVMRLEAESAIQDKGGYPGSRA
jgi:hypothetical protein